MKTLSLGRITAQTPVVLAPMAGVTNAPFRRLCRENGGGIFVSEMVTSRALVERTPESMHIIHHDPDEVPRSVQLYGVDPAIVGQAVRLLVDEDRADHIDLNFGCPVPKVTRKGGGSALPWKLDLFAAIVRAAVRGVGGSGIPVTVKMRKGIDDEHLTYLDAGRVAADEGAAALTLHGRTTADRYSGQADWSAIARLKAAVTTIPVLGNGDIWSAEDALAMVERTGCDGVVIGRGCQGRPWLFADLEAGFAGRAGRVRPGVDFVAKTVRRHTELLAEYYSDEIKGCREIRKHIAWYFKGYTVGGSLRSRLATVESLAQLDDLLAQLDLGQPYPGVAAEGPRGRGGGPKAPVLPEGWLESRSVSEELAQQLPDAELPISGG